MRQRKQRLSQGRFLAEGPGPIAEGLAAGRVEAVLATPEAARQRPDLVASGWWRIGPGELAGLADTVHSAGLVAICRHRPGDWAELLAGDPKLVVVCAEARDPGNVGTIIRCADAFGADAVVLTEGSVDPTNAKTVRASAGSIFHLPVVAPVGLDQALAGLRQAGLKLLAADAGGGWELDQLAADGGLSGPVAWLLGNEARGLPEAARRASDQLVRVPMWGRAESLNLAAATAVCLYATASAQRSGRPARLN
ncbi:MAG: RNA methyltransferase [Propionibacteriaceae bacterium]|nr:RNA methyltransferase [Propionibacteriaceae bacterium]